MITLQIILAIYFGYHFYTEARYMRKNRLGWSLLGAFLFYTTSTVVFLLASVAFSFYPVDQPIILVVMGYALSFFGYITGYYMCDYIKRRFLQERRRQHSSKGTQSGTSQSLIHSNPDKNEQELLEEFAKELKIPK